MPNADAFRVTFSPMAKDDVEEVHAIEKDSFPSPWPRHVFLEMLRSKETRFFTAFSDGKVVGYAGVKLGPSAHIVNLAVHRDSRRRRVGSRLLAYLLRVAAAQGAKRVTLEVRLSNTAAQKLYRRHGFAPVAVKKRYYLTENEDAVVMARDLVEEMRTARTNID